MHPSDVPELARTLGLEADSIRLTDVLGGSMARAWRLEAPDRTLFIKCMDPDHFDRLDAEHDGLQRLAENGALRTPAAAGCGRLDSAAWLALEWLQFGSPNASSLGRLGESLAELHRPAGEYYGLERDNFIGRTPQINTPGRDWTSFLFECRLEPQLARLGRRHARTFPATRLAPLRERWEREFGDYQPTPSLLHGDFWSGNAEILADGTPVVFDPAVHFGDRECDLAMADLFGGFKPAFFRAYVRAWPLEPGWEERRRFYQLYHLLNHANLFGGHYLDICNKLIDDLARSGSRSAD